MASKRIAEFEVGDRIVGTFAAREKTLANFRGKPGQYLSLTLSDATGDIPARMWDNAEEAARLFEAGDAVTVRGVVEDYRGQKQLVIEQIKRAEDDEVTRAELLPTTPRDVAALRKRLRKAVDSVRQPYLRALLEHFFGDEEFMARFAHAPGAKSLHHAYLGGLLEHSVAVLEIVEVVTRVHPELDRDLLVAGALLHDLGKVEELECGTAIRYTDRGRLVGHTVLTDRMVSEAIADIEGFPDELADRLTHLLLAHHGQREYGAPVLPMTAEACALHYADNLDAHVHYFNRIISEGAAAGSQWSDFQHLFDRYIFVGARGDAPGGQMRPQATESPSDPDRDRTDDAPGSLFDAWNG